MACIDRRQTTNAWLRSSFYVMPYLVPVFPRLFQKESIDLAELGKAVSTTLHLLRPYQSGCTPNGYLASLETQLNGPLKDCLSPFTF